jgi:myb proto-oncogene protein
MHGGEDWDAVAALVPGRTKVQCYHKCRDTRPSMDQASGRKGKWLEDEDIKLKDALQTQGGLTWDEVAALVPGRNRNQCWKRWKHVLEPCIHHPNGRTGKWTEDEDAKLKNAVQTHVGKNWPLIAALVPGRTKIQCQSRCQATLDPSMGWESAYKGKWLEEEDIKLKDAVQTHGKNWFAVATLVPGRTRTQCLDRWENVDPSMDWESTRKGKWLEDEDIKLKDAVQTCGTTWVAVAALVPGRSKKQCENRWHNKLARPHVSERKGKWLEDEDIKLKDAVQMHGKNWVAVATLVPGRTRIQCLFRWRNGRMSCIPASTI